MSYCVALPNWRQRQDALPRLPAPASRTRGRTHVRGRSCLSLPRRTRLFLHPTLQVTPKHTDATTSHPDYPPGARRDQLVCLTPGDAQQGPGLRRAEQQPLRNGNRDT